MQLLRCFYNAIILLNHIVKVQINIILKLKQSINFHENYSMDGPSQSTPLEDSELQKLNRIQLENPAAISKSNNRTFGCNGRFALIIPGENA